MEIFSKSQNRPSIPQNAVLCWSLLPSIIAPRLQGSVWFDGFGLLNPTPGSWCMAILGQICAIPPNLWNQCFGECICLCNSTESFCAYASVEPGQQMLLTRYGLKGVAFWDRSRYWVTRALTRICKSSWWNLSFMKPGFAYEIFT